MSDYDYLPPVTSLKDAIASYPSDLVARQAARQAHNDECKRIHAICFDIKWELMDAGKSGTSEFLMARDKARAAILAIDTDDNETYYPDVSPYDMGASMESLL